MKIFTCSECSSTGNQKEFLDHCFRKHSEEMISKFSISEISKQRLAILNDVGDSINNQILQSLIDPYGEIINSDGNISIIGTTSKFYCGKDSGHEC